jgi:hypothetical protein
VSDGHSDEDSEFDVPEEYLQEIKKSFNEAKNQMAMLERRQQEAMDKMR